MTTYAVGDLQGCLKPLQYLLKQVDFCTGRDNLWLVGDLVNRGTQSLEVLRFLYNMQNCTQIVLGNHDLHLLACNLNPQFIKKNDTLKQVLNALDKNKLLNWLQIQPLIHFDAKRNTALVHAGIAPNWSITSALNYANLVHDVLRKHKTASNFLLNLYGNDVQFSTNFNSKNISLADLRYITNVFTRMRFCNQLGVLELNCKSSSKDAPQGFAPWFEFERISNNAIIFGHWAALKGKCDKPNIWALDTGYIWGGELTMLNLDTLEKISCTQL